MGGGVVDAHEVLSPCGLPHYTCPHRYTRHRSTLARSMDGGQLPLHIMHTYMVVLNVLSLVGLVYVSLVALSSVVAHE